jgi:hypothetical protein
MPREAADKGPRVITMGVGRCLSRRNYSVEGKMAWFVRLRKTVRP